MKIDLTKIPEDFVTRPVEVAGEMCYLIFPPHIGIKWTKDNLIYRSLVVNSEGYIISAGFPKFFNWNEQPDLCYTPFSLTANGGVQLIEKIDGCCDENTILITEDGEKTIREICETKYKGCVLTYNHDNESEEFSPVLAHFIQDNNNDWYELELGDGSTIKLTENHQVWLSDLGCYRRVDKLNGDENILLKK